LEPITEKINKIFLDDIKSIVKAKDNKNEKAEKYDDLRKRIISEFSEEHEEQDIKLSLGSIEKKEIRNALLNEKNKTRW